MIAAKGEWVQRTRVVARQSRIILLLLFCCTSLSGLMPASAGEAPSEYDIVVFGDSQAAGIARGLQRLLLNDPRFKVLNRTHPGAAVVHEEIEWLEPVRQFVGHDKADIAIVMLGGNDRLDMRDGRVYLHFRTDSWRAAYAKRVDTIMSTLAAADLKTIWCGNPIARSDTYSADMSYLNALYAGEVKKFIGIRFVPLWSVVADNDGKYTPFGKALDGVTVQLRGDDGIHFTSAGYELIADKLAALIPAIPSAITTSVR
jgi:uncharacterized protein